MPTSVNAQLADAVVTALNASGAQSGFVLGFTAVRRPVPVRDLTALSALSVTVIPWADESDRNTRESGDRKLTLKIGIEKAVAAADVSDPSANAEVDELLFLTEQVCDFFGPTTIDQTTGFFFSDATVSVLQDHNALLTENLYRGIVTVEFLYGL